MNLKCVIKNHHHKWWKVSHTVLHGIFPQHSFPAPNLIRLRVGTTIIPRCFGTTQSRVGYWAPPKINNMACLSTNTTSFVSQVKLIWNYDIIRSLYYKAWWWLWRILLSWLYYEWEAWSRDCVCCRELWGPTLPGSGEYGRDSHEVKGHSHIEI